jgi:hypothetical protein
MEKEWVIKWVIWKEEDWVVEEKHAIEESINGIKVI